MQVIGNVRNTAGGNAVMELKKESVAVDEIERIAVDTNAGEQSDDKLSWWVPVHLNAKMIASCVFGLWTLVTYFIIELK